MVVGGRVHWVARVPGTSSLYCTHWGFLLSRHRVVQYCSVVFLWLGAHWPAGCRHPGCWSLGCWLPSTIMPTFLQLSHGPSMGLYWKHQLGHLVPNRVLIVRLSAIGDCVLTLPLAVEVKKLWPQCHLTWAVSCGARQILAEHESVDEVLEIPRRWLKSTEAWLDVRRQLRSRRFDLVLDPQGLTKSALIAWLTRAQVRLGFNRTQAREIAPFLYTHRVARTKRHMVDTFLELLRPWQELPNGGGEFRMPVFPEAAAAVEQWLHQQRLGDRWVALNPGAGWPTKQWPPERFGILARELYRLQRIRSVVFWGTEDERLLAQIAVEESEGAARLAPDCCLLELTEFLRRSTLMVCGDTGPLHLASAVGAPAVSLHGPTWSDEVGPYGNLHYAIQSNVPVPSRRFKRRGPPYSMLAIELSEVLQGCLQVLEQRPASSIAPAA
ncbi:MAG: hypothetical protein KatS3mg111_3735 [Pirellulaceae bacterium]|nr:MAG: hypothetical protein KatS3mg111_3735 [Pirellulaceae bacterium]